MATVIRKLVDATLILDNNVVGYVPNSLSFTEGLGTQKLRTQTAGAGSIQHVLTEDVSTRVSTVKFSLEPTVDNVALIRSIKADQTGHVITISQQGFTRTITGAVLTNDFEVKLGMDDVIAVEFHGNSAV